MKRRILLLLLTAVLLGGCAPKDAKFDNSFYAMDRLMSMQIWGSDTSDAAMDMSELIHQIEDDFAPTAQPGQTHQALIDQAEALCQRTGGAYCPTLYAAKEAWGIPTVQYRVPTQDQLDQALLEDRLDLTDILKGYAASKCVEYLQQHQLDCAFLELGSTVQTYGQCPDGAPWTVRIYSPRGTGVVGTLDVTGTATVSTAGDFLSYFQLSGESYCSILDPATGRPADAGIAAVTVICADGPTADALSTALYVMGLEEGTRLWRESDDFEAVFILTDGQILATEGAVLTGCQYRTIPRQP